MSVHSPPRGSRSRGRVTPAEASPCARNHPTPRGPRPFHATWGRLPPKPICRPVTGHSSNCTIAAYFSQTFLKPYFRAFRDPYGNIIETLRRRRYGVVPKNNDSLLAHAPGICGHIGERKRSRSPQRFWRPLRGRSGWSGTSYCPQPAMPASAPISGPTPTFRNLTFWNARWAGVECALSTSTARTG